MLETLVKMGTKPQPFEDKQHVVKEGDIYINVSWAEENGSMENIKQSGPNQKA